MEPSYFYCKARTKIFKPGASFAAKNAFFTIKTMPHTNVQKEWLAGKSICLSKID